MTEVVDFPVKPEARDYLARFARDAGEPGWLAARRQQAMTRFAELGFPSRRSESWRYLDLQPLERTPLLPAAPAGAPRQRRVARAGCRARPVGRGRPSRPGRWPLRARAVAACRRDAGSGSARWPRQCASGRISPRPQWRKYRARRRSLSRRSTPPFSPTALSSSLEPGVVLDAPIEIVHLASGASEASFHTRSLVIARRRQPRQHHRDLCRRGPLLAQRRRRGAPRRRRGAALAPSRSRRRRRRCISGISMRRSRPRRGFAGFALLLGGRRVRHEANVRLAGEGGRVAARRRLSGRRQRRGEHRHHGRSRRARRADQRTDQGRRGRTRPRRVSGPHHRARGRAEDRCAASRAAT